MPLEAIMVESTCPSPGITYLIRRWLKIEELEHAASKRSWLDAFDPSLGKSLLFGVLASFNLTLVLSWNEGWELVNCLQNI